jgi:hypothetical protein
MSRILPAAFALLVASPLIAAPTIKVADGKIVVTGVSSSERLRVVVADGTAAEIAARPAVSGEWTTVAGNAVFAPKYPLNPGTRYRLLGAGDGLEVRVPKPEPGKPTVVTHIFPTAAELPENVLRFYIEFNKPMPRGEVYKHVRIENDKGQKIELPFLEIDDELWNPEQTRITLLIDPGRIKQEVKPRIDLGPVFVRGRKYTLVVSGKWPTLGGEPLGDDVRKPIVAGPAVTDALDPKTWTILAPVDPKAALQVGFGRPMDAPIVARSLTVFTEVDQRKGQQVSGTWEANPGDRTWMFKPAAPWAAGGYLIEVSPVLEDVCANRVGRPFEVDLLKPSKVAVQKPRTIDLAFTVRQRHRPFEPFERP